jgi:hypothetical protein
MNMKLMIYRIHSNRVAAADKKSVVSIYSESILLDDDLKIHRLQKSTQYIAHKSRAQTKVYRHSSAVTQLYIEKIEEWSNNGVWD